MRGRPFVMSISNQPFIPVPDDLQHDVFSGECRLLTMDVLDTIVRKLDAHLASARQARIITTRSGDDPLTTARPAPAEQPRGDNRTLRINPQGLLCKKLPLLVSQPAPFVPC